MAMFLLNDSVPRMSSGLETCSVWRAVRKPWGLEGMRPEKVLGTAGHLGGRHGWIPGHSCLLSTGDPRPTPALLCGPTCRLSCRPTDTGCVWFVCAARNSHCADTDRCWVHTLQVIKTPHVHKKASLFTESRLRSPKSWLADSVRCCLDDGISASMGRVRNVIQSAWLHRALTEDVGTELGVRNAHSPDPHTWTKASLLPFQL